MINNRKFRRDNFLNSAKNMAFYRKIKSNGILEILGGILLMLGLFTRPTAFILSGQMAVAYFMAHASKSILFPIANGGESAVLFCFIFLYIATSGGGKWALDNLLINQKELKP